MTDLSSDNGEFPGPIGGLPVSGYRPQSREAIDSVNALKDMEEHVLRLLDEVEEEEGLAADKRWMAIGRTAIQQGFMAVNRSIFKPGRIDIRPEGITAWLIERGDSSPAGPLYYATGGGHGEQWTRDHNQALRFARDVDAGMLALALGVECRIAEHQWG
jgi:hypothetical protein